MSIRVAQRDDEAQVVALWRSCGLVVSYNDPAQDFLRAISSSCSDVLVYESQGEGIVGSVLVGYDGHRGWVYYVAAAPKVRGRGIGRKMVEAAERWLQRRGALKVQLLVRDTNPKAVSFYEHLGFEPAEHVVMGKWLEQSPPE